MRKNNPWRLELKESLTHIMPLFWHVSILFFCSLLLGIMFSSLTLTYLAPLFDNLKSVVSSQGFFPLFLFIFFNNARVAFLSILLGPSIIAPYLFIFTNGIIIGAVVRAATPGTLFLLLPHGIFELPAILLSFAYAIKIGRACLFHRNKLTDAYAEGFIVLVKLILPLLLFAALIESFLITVLR